MSTVSDDLSDTVSKLVELSKQLSEAKSDIKILNQEEKRLKESLKMHMINQGIDTINLRKGKISLRKSIRKTGMKKDAIRDGLGQYFGGDEVKIEGVMNAIQDNLKVKETTAISLTGIKDKANNDSK